MTKRRIIAKLDLTQLVVRRRGVKTGVVDLEVAIVNANGAMTVFEGESAAPTGSAYISVRS